MTIGSLMPRRCELRVPDAPFLRHWRAYRDGFREMLVKFPANFYAVANFNCHDIEPAWCRAQLNFLDMKLGRLLLGKNWSRKPSSERIKWVAVPEHATYLHYNVLLDVPAQHHERLWFDGPRLWREVVPTGQLHIQVIAESERDVCAVRMYSSKTFHPDWTIENTVTSMEFQRKKKLDVK